MCTKNNCVVGNNVTATTIPTSIRFIYDRFCEPCAFTSHVPDLLSPVVSAPHSNVFVYNSEQIIEYDALSLFADFKPYVGVGLYWIVLAYSSLTPIHLSDGHLSLLHEMS